MPRCCSPKVLAERGGPRIRLSCPRRSWARALAALVERYGHLWSKAYRDDPGRLLEEALERLEHLGLIARRAGGVEPLPAVARYKAVEPAAREDGDE